MKKSRERGITIITCTNRPQFFNRIIKNYKRQLYRNKKLIIVLNNDTMDLSEYRKKTPADADIQVYKKPANVSLGRCLNYAVQKSNSPFIARFDDDDYYSPYYLSEQIKTLRRSGAGIVGKSAHLLYLRRKKLLIMRNPKHRNMFVSFVPGGTLLWKRSIVKQVRFADTSNGEDTKFLRQCRRKGYKIYASSPYNFVGIRRKDKKSHTWKAKDNDLLKGSRIVAKTVKFRRVAIRRMKL